MNVNDSKFNVPEYVLNASPDDVDANVDSAVTVEGLRIDTPAAAWIASAEIRKHANDFSYSAKAKVEEACKLFNITDDHFIPKQATASDLITISDGENVATFNIVDEESLHTAAMSLLNKRASVPYLFARECAIALRKRASDLGLTCPTDVHVRLKKLAGDYRADLSKALTMISEAELRTESAGMPKYASELRRVKNILTNPCPESLAPLVIEVLDQVNKALPLSKAASESVMMPEDVIYMTNSEYLAKQASDVIILDTGEHIRRDAITGSSRVGIARWATDNGYPIAANYTEADLASTLSRMPGALRTEFMDSFVR